VGCSGLHGDGAWRGGGSQTGGPLHGLHQRQGVGSVCPGGAEGQPDVGEGDPGLQCPAGGLGGQVARDGAGGEHDGPDAVGSSLDLGTMAGQGRRQPDESAGRGAVHRDARSGDHRGDALFGARQGIPLATLARSWRAV
jgi:hypothetical protein